VSEPKHSWSGRYADLVEHALAQKKELFATEEALLAFWEARDGRWLNELEPIQVTCSARRAGGHGPALGGVRRRTGAAVPQGSSLTSLGRSRAGSGALTPPRGQEERRLGVAAPTHGGRREGQRSVYQAPPAVPPLSLPKTSAITPQGRAARFSANGSTRPLVRSIAQMGLKVNLSSTAAHSNRPALVPVEASVWARGRGCALKALLHLAADQAKPGQAQRLDRRVGWRFSAQTSSIK
jgi:hypothetical protein